MANISKIKLPNNSEYDIYDPNAAHGTYAGSSTDGGPATTAKKLFGQDTRSVNSPPSRYMTSGQNSTLITEFKSRAAIDAPGSSGFGTLITITPWMDSSGGLPVQIYVDNTGQRAIRFAQTEETWGSWGTLALTGNIPSVGNGTIKLQRNGVDVLSFTTNQNGNTTGNLIVPTKVSELTNDSGYLTTHQDISGKYDKITQLGIKQCNGNGQYWYFKIATLTIAQGYVNGPIAFELSQREHEVTMIQVSFRSNSGTDPELGYFVTNQGNDYWIIKDTTSTWSIYGKYNEMWGACALHRIVGFRVNNGVTVTVNMENVSAIPSGATQAVYGGNCAFATSAGNASTVNNLTVQTAVPANAKFTDTTYTAGTGLRLSGTTFLADVKRLNGGDLNYKPGLNRFELQEVNATTGNIPSSKWYHVLTSEGSDSNYEVQLALSMTNVPEAYYRQLNGNVYSEWYRLSKALLQKYETGTITNNTWYRLFSIKYTQYNYLHLRVLVKAGYTNFYEAFICVRYTPSGMNGNATSIKIISTYNESTNVDSKSLVLYKIDDNTIALAAKAYGASSTLGFEILDITSEANAIKPESVIVDNSFVALSEEPTKFGVHSYLTGSYNDLANKPTITTYTFATGDSNGQIKVTPSGGSAQNVSVKGLGSAAYTNASNYATQTVLTNHNLNSLTVAGFYNAGGGNTVTNKPSGVDAFGLEVVHTAGGTYYVQILYKNGEVIPYRRYCNNGTWTSWVKDESVVYTSSVNAVVGDTTCTITDSSITTTSLIEPFSSNSTGDTIAIKNIAVTAGQAVLTFKALTVDTSFRLRVTNV